MGDDMEALYECNENTHLGKLSWLKNSIRAIAEGDSGSKIANVPGGAGG